eukprot:scaffold5198_cov247-Pinguiococcus_pyrenoidosus.AAC.10
MASEAAINGGSAARAAEGVERWNTAAQMDTSSSAQASESVQRPRPESYAQLLSQQYRQTPQSLPSVGLSCRRNIQGVWALTVGAGRGSGLRSFRFRGVVGSMLEMLEMLLLLMLLG